MSKFAHLHCHTEYSLMDGLIHIKDLCIRSKEFGMDACAITDHGNMYGAAKFYKSCKDYELKPIIGCEVYVYQDYQNSESYSAKQCNHLILLSQTLQGYHNLTKLVSRSYLDVIDGKPCVKKEKLRQYQEGLICLSGCIKGEIPEAIFANDMDRARRLAEEYHYIFPDRFYLELESNGLKEQEIVNNGLLDLAKTFSLPIVATNNCHYLDKSDYTAHEVLLCIGENKRLKDQNRLSYATNEFYLKSPEEMEKAFYDLPEAIDNTLRIADSCNVDLDLGQHCFPVYRLSEGTNSENELSKLAKEGLKQRFENHPNHEKLNEEIYWKRLQYEIDVILGMGFSQYFLVTHEVVNWAKKHGIPVGPGHGLVTGSLVAWAMQLTDIDPIHYHLLFERFLNSKCSALPVICIDFCERRLHEVVQHLRDTYGKDHVAQLILFETLNAQTVLSEVARVLNFPVYKLKTLSRMVSPISKSAIKASLSYEDGLKVRYEKENDVKDLFDIASRLEGVLHHVCISESGLVVSEKHMVEYLPLCVQNDAVITQFDKSNVEQSGLMVFDFIGLKTLTEINNVLETIRQNGKTPPDLGMLNLDDSDTYQVLCQGDTDGVFMMEGAEIREYLRMLQPSCFENIIAFLALYRPGPMYKGMLSEFIKRKNSETSVNYPDESLKVCLNNTCGVIVYQEQVMEIAQIVGGFTPEVSYLLRKSLMKRRSEEMVKWRSDFLVGAAKKGIGAEKANELFNLIEEYTVFTFSKSHAAAYGLISFYMAYLKAHFRNEFMDVLTT